MCLCCRNLFGFQFRVRIKSGTDSGGNAAMNPLELSPHMDTSQIGRVNLWCGSTTNKPSSFSRKYPIYHLSYAMRTPHWKRKAFFRQIKRTPVALGKTGRIGGIAKVARHKTCNRGNQQETDFPHNH